MINEVTHILSHFDKSDFGDFDRELWKSREALCLPEEVL